MPDIKSKSPKKSCSHLSYLPGFALDYIVSPGGIGGGLHFSDLQL